MTSPFQEPKTDDYYQPYFEYAKILRTWFIGYGIGLPALILTNEKLTTPLLAARERTCLLSCLLLGVILQVLAAFLNKHSMWVLYNSSPEIPPASKGGIYRIANWYAHQNWTDPLFDLSTAFVFIFATIRAYLIFP